MAAGHVECVDDALHGTEREDFGDGDAVREREPGKGERLQHGQGLRPDQNFAAVDAINEDAGERSEEKGWNLAGEADGAQQERGFGEPVDKPGRGDARHPGADEGDALAAEEEPEVAMAQARQACE